MFYDRFASLCSQRGISPSRAAVEAGISKSLVTKWKTNKVKYPSADIAQKLATYFGLSVAELLDEESEKAPTPEGERPITFDDFTYAMYEESRELTEENKARLLDMAKFFRQQQDKNK